MATTSSSVLAHPRARWVVLALAVLVTLPALGLGFVTDDYGFRALLHAPAPYGRPAYDLFRFASGDPAVTARAIHGGHMPWWTTTDLRIHFLRPLSGLAFAVDDALFGSHALLDHLVSIGWYVALVAAVGALYQRLFPGRIAATVALVVFALSHAHVMPYAWLAARHILVGAVPAVVAVWAHVRAEREGWRLGRWLAPVALLIALAGSEAALGGALFWLSFDYLGDRAKPWRARFLASVPALVILAAYVVVYRLAGGGARESGGYHDPVGDPLGFARVAVTRVPMLLGDALLGVPSELGNVIAPLPLVVAGCVAMAVVGAAYFASRSLASTEERAALAWLVPGALAATLLGATGFPGGRVLVLPDVGFAALIGVVLAHGFDAGARRGLRIGLAALLALVHLVLAPLSSWRAIASLGRRARASEAVAADIGRAAPDDGRVFLIASDPQVFLYPRGILADTDPGTLRCFSVLSAARASHRITRTGDRTITLEPIERTLLDGSFDTLFRAGDRPFAVGDTVRQCGAAIRVTAVKNGRPGAMDITFDTSLDDPELVLLVWRDRHVDRFIAPAVGAAIDVPWSPGPAAM